MQTVYSSLLLVKIATFKINREKRNFFFLTDQKNSEATDLFANQYLQNSVYLPRNTVCLRVDTGI